MGEVFILFLLVVLINNYFGRKDVIIKADGKGYYDYLPAMYIYNDLQFSYLDTLTSELYPSTTEYTHIKGASGERFNKYFIGTSVLITPFFLFSHGIAKSTPEYKADGYSQPYQDGVFYAALFYLWLGLLYLRKLAVEFFAVSRMNVFLVQLVLVLATPISHYAYGEASYSHVYSFSMVACLFYHFKASLERNRTQNIVMVGLLFGLVLIIRPVNLLIILFLPILVSKPFELFNWTRQLLATGKVKILASILGAALPITFMCAIWLHQTGRPFVWSYEEEGFQFGDPHMWDFLFSFDNGMMVYTPVLLLMIGGYLFLTFGSKQYVKAITFITAFLMVIYVQSSWWFWSYGHSMGARTMIEFYPIFGFGFALFIEGTRKWIRDLSLLMAGVFTIINIIQVKQFEKLILHGEQMTSEDYWKVFLETHSEYEGILYHEELVYGAEQISYERNYHGRSWTLIDSGWVVYDTINVTSTAIGVEVAANWCIDSGKTEFIIALDDENGNNYLWRNRPTFHVVQKYFQCQDDTVHVLFPQVKKGSHLKIMAKGHADAFSLSNLRIRVIDAPK